MKFYPLSTTMFKIGMCTEAESRSGSVRTISNWRMMQQETKDERFFLTHLEKAVSCRFSTAKGCVRSTVRRFSTAVLYAQTNSCWMITLFKSDVASVRHTTSMRPCISRVTLIHIGHQDYQGLQHIAGLVMSRRRYGIGSWWDGSRSWTGEVVFAGAWPVDSLIEFAILTPVEMVPYRYTVYFSV